MRAKQNCKYGARHIEVFIPFSRQSYVKTEDVWTDMELRFVCNQAIGQGN